MSTIKSLAPQIDLPAVEHQILSFWKPKKFLRKLLVPVMANPTGLSMKAHQLQMENQEHITSKLAFLKIYFRATKP